MMWGLIFICGKEREVSLKLYDEYPQNLQALLQVGCIYTKLQELNSPAK